MKVAVVGLGIAGLSICARLALAGHDVTGFDQFEPMHELGSSHGDTRIMRLTPGEGDHYVQLARRAGEIWRTWEGLAGQPLIEWTTGLMAGPRGSPFVDTCQRLSRKPASLLRGDAIHTLTRGYIAMPYEWDVFRQEDVGVIAADAVRAFLLRQAPRWGARIAHRARIEGPIESTTLRINGETHAFDSVIVAAGGWAAKLLPEFAGRLAVKRRVVGWFSTPEPRMLPVMCIDNDVGTYGMPAPRGLYAGPFGWLDASGDGAFVVALRSALFAGDRAYVYAGAGIVRDSAPGAELAETELKMQAILGALDGEAR